MKTRLELLEKRLKAYRHDNRILQDAYSKIISSAEPLDHKEINKISLEQEIVLLKIKVIEELYRNEFELKTLDELSNGKEVIK